MLGFIKIIIKTTLSALLFSSALLSGKVIPAAEQTALYLPLLKNKNVAVVVNHSSMLGERHLIDVLLSHGIKVKKIFAPEHGFRGKADAGAHIKNSVDNKTALPIISLYGKHKKPTKKDLQGIDLILFDIQDVGVRFYTYLSTLHYIMEAGAEQNIPLLLLDRPNPNGQYIDGPVLEKKHRSFVGLHPVPVVYGMTIGEYAQMINGEKWLKNSVQVELKVIKVKNYRHQSHYALTIKPSPNLPTDQAITLYPSLAFFEGTVISAGRGTNKPFELYGAPSYADKTFSFVPKSKVGAKHPKFINQRCYGVDLSRSRFNKKRFTLAYLQDAYAKYPDKKNFFLKNNFFDALSGNSQLRKQIKAGLSEKQIRKSWQKNLNTFKQIRKKYLIYP